MVVEEASSRYGPDFVIVPNTNHITISRPQQKTSTSFLALKGFIDKVCKNPKVAGDVHLTQGLPDFSSGLEKRVQDVLKIMLEKGTSQATVIGIVGMGGIGKTTLARRVFNETSVQFEYTCFVDNVKGIPIHNLTDCLLSQFHRHGVKVGGMQWSHLKEKKTLIVMDDVEGENQLKYLPKLHDIGGSSRLIFTSRDHNVSNPFSSYCQYEVDFLNDDDAKKLFCLHVFGVDEIPKDLMEKDHRLGDCVDRVVLKCQGLPLTLEVVGCYLRKHKDNVGFWNETIEKLGEAKPVDGRTNDRVWASLRISYDDLAPAEKEMFIDAGTVFFERSLDVAFAAWSGSIDYVESTWENLLERSLVKVISDEPSTWKLFGDYVGTIWVHDQLRDLAKKVSERKMVSIHDVNNIKKWVSNAAISVVGRCNETEGHLWFDSRMTKTEDRRGLDLDMTRIESLRDSSTLQLESLEQMQNLKYLDLKYMQSEGLCKNFPKNLSLLILDLISEDHSQLPGISWNEMRNLGVLHLRHWKISTGFLEGMGNLTNLRFLKLEDLEGLDRLPQEIGNLSCLRKLILERSKLSRLPDSFGDLRALEYLSLCALKILQLPGSFGGLHSLTHLHISMCSKLGSLPEAFGDLSRLKWLHFSVCRRLESLPESFGLLASLENLCFIDMLILKRLPGNFGRLKALRRLDIGNCSELEALSDSFGKLSSLEELRLTSLPRLQRLPDNFGDLTSLKELKILRASNLEALCNSFGSLSALTDLKIYDCPSLQDLPASFGKLSSLEKLTLGNCSRLQRLPDSFGELTSLKKLTIGRAHHLQNLCDNFGSLSGLTCLKLRDCPKLENPPLTFGLLHGLKKLELISCSSLQRLPETFGPPMALKKLIIRKADHLEELCGNFELLSDLEELELDRYSHFQQFLNTPGKLRVKKLTLTIHEADHLSDLCDDAGLRFKVESLVLTIKCPELKRLPDNLGQLTALTELSILRADHLEELPDYITDIPLLKEINLYQCKRLKNLGKSSSPELPIPRADSASPSPINSEGSKAALKRVLHEFRQCNDCRMRPIEGTRFYNPKRRYNLCSDCFEKADDQEDFVRVNQPVNRWNGLRVKIVECPLLDTLALARLGWIEHHIGLLDREGIYIRFT